MDQTKEASTRERKIATSVRLDIDTLSRLEVVAGRLERSRNYIINKACQMALPELEREAA